MILPPEFMLDLDSPIRVVPFLNEWVPHRPPMTGPNAAMLNHAKERWSQANLSGGSYLSRRYPDRKPDRFRLLFRRPAFLQMQERRTIAHQSRMSR